MDSLLSATDPDWSAFKAGDESYFLNAAGDAIRRFCGWHIAPSLTVTLDKLRVGSSGIIEVPSTYVTDVLEVALEQRAGALKVLEPTDYVWMEYGIVQLRQAPHANPWGYYGGYGFMPGGYLPGAPLNMVRMTLTHGYDEVPAEVKQVAFELVNSSTDMPSGNVREIQTPGFKLQLSQAAGMSLNSQQMDRLSSFRLSRAR